MRPQFKALRIGVALLVLGGAAPVWSQAEIPLASRALLGGVIKMLAPTAFRPMPENLLKLKYPMERRPTYVLSNESGSVSLALNHTRNSLKPEQLAEAHGAFDQMFRNLYPSAHWYRSELITVNGRRFMILELRTPAVDTEIRNLMVGTSLDGRLLLISVNMTRELEGQWLEVANRMIASVTIQQ
jgi:hypothetical protein